ncbi:MAG: hypothetical protein JWL64_198 [Frankiales bacterium]|nr:hypothetical protein [Frankiales bacterium]
MTSARDPLADPHLDRNRAPRHAVPMWSETRWNGCYNPEQGVGLFLHAGRLRGHLDWWWAQTAIYLPGGRMAVERSWVRSPDDVGVKTASLDLRVLEHGWSASFDGIVEVTTTAALASATRGSAAPVVPAAFELVADASRPWWDMLAGAASQDFGDMHVEQVSSCAGTLTVGEERYRLDGVGYYDHSSGVRDWTNFHAHHFAMIAMPDYTLHLGSVYTSPTEGRAGGGVWFPREGKPLRIRASTMPRQADVLGAPHEFDWVLDVAGQGELTFRVEVLHTFPNTITLDNDNINGIDWEIPGDPLYPTECQVRVTAPDGAVGYGHLERSNRRSASRAG